MQFNEKKLRVIVKPHLLRCRDGDWNHALRVVAWVKKLGRNNANLKLLITAAYLHDVGWRDVLPKGRITLNKLLEFEQRANDNSKPFVTGILYELGYTTDEIDVVNRYIKAADSRKPNTKDEEIITDADNLSKLDLLHSKEKYKKSEWKKMHDHWTRELPKRIRTNEAKKLYPKLLNNLKEDIEKEI